MTTRYATRSWNECDWKTFARDVHSSTVSACAWTFSAGFAAKRWMNASVHPHIGILRFALRVEPHSLLLPICSAMMQCTFPYPAWRHVRNVVASLRAASAISYLLVFIAAAVAEGDMLKDPFKNATVQNVFLLGFFIENASLRLLLVRPGDGSAQIVPMLPSRVHHPRRQKSLKIYGQRAKPNIISRSCSDTFLQTTACRLMTRWSCSRRESTPSCIICRLSCKES